MATPHILENVRIFTGGCDLTGYSNKLELAAEVEEKDVTTFNSVDAAGHVWKELKGGLAQASVNFSGFWQAGDTSMVDDDSWAALGGAGSFTVFPGASTEGSLAYLTSLLRASYGLLGPVGEVAPWVGTGKSTWPLTRGLGLHPPGTARIATGNGTGVQHVAVGASQYLYATLHVLSVAGTGSPTLTVAVQSDSDNTFASPATQITFTAATARTGETKRVAGAITDTWYRVSYTISGSSPSFLFVVAIGIF